jgi:hypothetical protein
MNQNDGRHPTRGLRDAEAAILRIERRTEKKVLTTEEDG